jgi:4-hydroxy-3-methylbut-2-enyl diphosphate reductase
LFINNYYITKLLWRICLKKNIGIIEDLEKIDKNTIVILRTHGESKKTYEFLEKNKIEYYDATCKKVADIHKTISEKYNQNYDIVIIGNKNDDNSLHAEVEGSNGWCDGNAIIISHEAEIKNICFKNKKALIICQSTYNTNQAVRIAELLKKEYADISFEFINSICNIQSIIQRESVNLAKNCDYMIVLGGKNSSNTKELYNKCSSVCQSYHCQDLKEVITIVKNISDSSKIGITGGASTPKYVIENCKDMIDFYQFYKKEKAIFEKEIEKYNQKIMKMNPMKLFMMQLKNLMP